MFGQCVRRPEEGTGSPENAIWAVVTLLTWVPGTELGSSMRAASILTEASSLQHCFWNFLAVYFCSYEAKPGL